MDETECAILAHLMENGRLANTELADLVGLSSSPCLRRVRQLENSGVITGYRATVEPAAVGELDEVANCLRMFGQPDYLLWIAVPDLDAY
ncbi:winged helix-turn-helix transcriptional regulator, partial [Streptomyces sp. NPDC006349]|uniref:Lrp/AsnC family transcriptional regulator n=2 Tax=Streptomyces TaxID=1883 RepID=UPI0033AA6792